MPSGVFAKLNIAAATWTTLVAPAPSGTFKVATVNLCNRTSSDIKVRIALAASTTVADTDYIEYDTTIVANGVLERTGILIDSTFGIQVYAATAGITAAAYGIDS